MWFYSVAVYAQSGGDIWQFTAADRAFLSLFSLEQLPPLPAAPDNALADNELAARLGRALFFDRRLSANGELACAHCHQPQRYFTDGLPQAQALFTTRRSAPSILGAGFSTWLNWDGRKDSLWSQALGPIEDASELGMARSDYVRLLLSHYRSEFETLLGSDFSLDSAWVSVSASPVGDPLARAAWESLPIAQREAINRLFATAGKALMAYQRRLNLPLSPFDQFLKALKKNDLAAMQKIFTADEVQGLRIFVGKANCASCHNGPLLTNHEFHNIGAPEVKPQEVDLGRFEGVKRLLNDEFNCLSPWSDASAESCLEMRFLKTEGLELIGAFKTPSLRNVSATPPYMQSGQFSDLMEVIEHYNLPTPPFYDREQHPARPHFDILPLQLSELEKRQLLAFLFTLTSPLPINDPWWFPEDRFSEGREKP